MSEETLDPSLRNAILKTVLEGNKKKEEKIKDLQTFIQRFSANASKSKQATSRKKLLDKITLDDIRPSSRRYPYVAFKPDREAGDQLLTVEGICKTIDGEKILDDVKKQKEMELRNIDLQISDIKSRTVALIDKKLENSAKTLENLQEQLKLVDENLKKIDTLNPSLAALKLMEKKDITTAISELTVKNFELEEKKDLLLTTSLYKLEENKKIVETIREYPFNCVNSKI